VQVQRWLGHHSPSFTLSCYVHLLPEDLPDPMSAVTDVVARVRGRDLAADLMRAAATGVDLRQRGGYLSGDSDD
jgi:hypothetical protein